MLTKRITISTVIVILLAVFFFWGTDYIYAVCNNSSNPERERLLKENEAVNSLIAKIPEPPAGLDIKLAQLEDELRKEEQMIPDTIDSAAIIDSILKLAESCYVTAIPLQTNDWSIENGDYMVYTVNIMVEGNYQQIEHFISCLENDLYDTLTIVSIGIKGGLNTDTGDTEPDIANLHIAVYTRN